jgi:hypothetical protein
MHLVLRRRAASRGASSRCHPGPPV